MNPTGKVFCAEELDFIAGLLRQHDAYAVCDEVYEHLVFAGAKHLPLMTLPGMGERSLRIGSAGKTFSLTGWKVGYVSGPPALISLVTKAHQNLTFTTPPNLQRAVALGLAKPDAYFGGLADGLQAGRDLLDAGLTRLGFSTLPAQGSYFITADFTGLGYAGDDFAFARSITAEAGVAAIPVSAFYAGVGADAGSRSYVRFAFCKQPAVLEEALRRLETWLSR
jgi:aspartate/methionine/tyrosine aminotransferase